jgi:hypothetical protein
VYTSCITCGSLDLQKFDMFCVLDVVLAGKYCRLQLQLVLSPLWEHSSI